jgi:hypothetical protein
MLVDLDQDTLPRTGFNMAANLVSAYEYSRLSRGTHLSVIAECPDQQLYGWSEDGASVLLDSFYT